MIGALPITLNVHGIERAINSDYITAINIMAMFQDENLLDWQKSYGLAELLYVDGAAQFTTEEEAEEANEQACWFLNGNLPDPSKKEELKLIDWEQDESLIFSAVNAVAGREVRLDPDMHWWTFLAFYSSISAESTLSFIISLRQKVFKHKKLEPTEKEFLKNNHELIYFVREEKKTAEEEQAERELNALLGI